MMEDMDLGLKIPFNFPIAIWYELLVVIRDMDIGPISSPLHLITQVTIIYCCVHLVLLGTWMILFIKHERGDIRGDVARLGSSSQYIIYYSFHNCIESVYGDRRIGFWYHTSPTNLPSFTCAWYIIGFL